jgi:hypothetical protein
MMWPFGMATGGKLEGEKEGNAWAIGSLGVFVCVLLWRIPS